jgi:non-homologous end joining protein Ku
MWAGAIAFGPLPGGDLVVLDDEDSARLPLESTHQAGVLHFAPADPFRGY